MTSISKQCGCRWADNFPHIVSSTFHHPHCNHTVSVMNSMDSQSMGTLPSCPFHHRGHHMPKGGVSNRRGYGILDGDMVGRCSRHHEQCEGKDQWCGGQCWALGGGIRDGLSWGDLWTIDKKLCKTCILKGRSLRSEILSFGLLWFLLLRQVNLYFLL